jgi:hypothetical protein
MAKCQHCGSVIEGAQIIYRDATKGRRAHSIRLCGRCVDQHDRIEAGKKVRNIVLGILALGILIALAGYLLTHQ